MIEMDLVDDIEEIKEEKEYLSPFVIYNGEILSLNVMCSDIASSVFVHGICLRDSVLCSGVNMIMADTHFKNLYQNMKQMGFGLGNFVMFDEFKRNVELLCYKNKYPTFSRLDIYCWYKTSTSVNQVCWLITQTKMNKLPYNEEYSKKILKTYTEGVVSKSKWINIKMSNVVESMADMAVKSEGYWGACIINENKDIIRTTRGNLFLIAKEDVGASIIAVKTEGGAYNDALMEKLDYTLYKLKYKVNSVMGITSDMIDKSLGAFVLDSSIGLHVLHGIDKVRYSNRGLTNDILEQFKTTIFQQ